MKRPSLAAELQQLLCATNWMRTSFPNYSSVVARLHELLEKSCQAVGKRTRAAVRKFDISGLWDEEHEAAFI